MNSDCQYLLKPKTKEIEAATVSEADYITSNVIHDTETSELDWDTVLNSDPQKKKASWHADQPSTKKCPQEQLCS